MNGVISKISVIDNYYNIIDSDSRNHSGFIGRATSKVPCKRLQKMLVRLFCRNIYCPAAKAV